MSAFAKTLEIESNGGVEFFFVLVNLLEKVQVRLPEVLEIGIRVGVDAFFAQQFPQALNEVQIWRIRRQKLGLCVDFGSTKPVIAPFGSTGRYLE